MMRVRHFFSRFFGRPEFPAPDTANEPQHPQFTSNIREFEQLIGYRIRNSDLFVRALVHRSSLQQRHPANVSNERLEFLGDSILNLIVGEYLYRTFPRADEGDLTQIRSRLVNRKALATYAKAIRVADFVLTSPSAPGSLGKGHDTIAADSFEAVIAAIYLDGGFAAARGFVERCVLGALTSGDVITSDDNYKSMLLEYAQAKGLGVPHYVIIKEEGPDHDRTFTIEVSLGNKKCGTGTGKNKKEAEQGAARGALEHLHKDMHVHP